jgi:hypothetical protein
MERDGLLFVSGDLRKVFADLRLWQRLAAGAFFLQQACYLLKLGFKGQQTLAS